MALQQLMLLPADHIVEVHGNVGPVTGRVGAGGVTGREQRPKDRRNPKTLNWDRPGLFDAGRMTDQANCQIVRGVSGHSD